MGLFYFMISFKEYLSSWQPVSKAEHTPSTCPARSVALGCWFSMCPTEPVGAVLAIRMCGCHHKP